MTMRLFFNIHLVSDSTGETLNAVMRAAVAKFENVEPLEHNYYLVRTERKLDRVLTEIEGSPGVVWYTLSDDVLRRKLERFCRPRALPFLSVLDTPTDMLSRHLGVSASDRVAAQHTMDADYFDRMEAVEFTLRHDDGQGLATIHQADVILVGVSRTSKTPTCVYLSNRGIKAANIPLVPGVPPPQELLEISQSHGHGPLIVGLKVSPDRLSQIRKQRLIGLNESPTTSYADEDAIRKEVTDAGRLFQKQKWPVIDVSRRSIEETAAAILNRLERFNR